MVAGILTARHRSSTTASGGKDTRHCDSFLGRRPIKTGRGQQPERTARERFVPYHRSRAAQTKLKTWLPAAGSNFQILLPTLSHPRAHPLGPWAG